MFAQRECVTSSVRCAYGVPAEKQRNAVAGEGVAWKETICVANGSSLKRYRATFALWRDCYSFFSCIASSVCYGWEEGGRKDRIPCDGTQRGSQKEPETVW